MILEILNECAVHKNVTIARDGSEALDIMMKRGDHLSAPHPDLVILDLNLPRIHGHEVLSIVKSQESLKDIPVVVMTGSLSHEDEIKSRSMGIVDYYIKPVSADEYDTTLSNLRNRLDSLFKDREDRNGKGHQDGKDGLLRNEYLGNINAMISFSPALPFYRDLAVDGLFPPFREV